MSLCDVDTWTGGRDPKNIGFFPPFLSSFCGSGGWKQCTPKMSTRYHKGTDLGRDECTWSVTWALGSKFEQSSSWRGDTGERACMEKKERGIRVLHREAAESTRPAGDRCCHPGRSAVFLRMYSCFPIYHPPSYFHLLPQYSLGQSLLRLHSPGERRAEDGCSLPGLSWGRCFKSARSKSGPRLRGVVWEVNLALRKSGESLETQENSDKGQC